MPQLISFPTPRTKFQATASNLREHRALLENPAFERGTDSALAEYVRTLTGTPPPDMGGSAAAYLKIQGAVEVLRLLYSLADQPQASSKRDVDNLDHRS